MIVNFLCIFILLTMILVQLKTELPIKHQLYEILNFLGLIPSYNEICTNIYLGDHHSRLNIRFMRENNIKLVINATTEVSIKPLRNIKYLRVDDYQSYECIFDMIDKSILEKKGVLIHCYAGLGRSAKFLASYLRYKLNTSYLNARNIIKKRRKFSFLT